MESFASLLSGFLRIWLQNCSISSSYTISLFYYFSIEYGTKRQFSVDWLEKYDWLRYSVSENSVYCAPCILFGASSPKEKTFINTPVSKWSNLGKYIKRHTEPGSSHHSCCASASSFMKIIEGKQASITAQLSRNKVETVAKNRQVLRSVIEVIILCGRQNIPLRGHDDNNSNFTVLLKDKANRDEILKTHLSSKSKVTYTSPMIQNELITLLGNNIKGKIVQQCNDAICYSFLADEATDASTMEQIAMCVRYYSEIEQDLREDFVGFVQAESTTGEALFNKFIEGQRDAGLDISKMRGQGYDGASNMSGCHRGVQARVQQVVPQAMYVHCKAHSLNLSIVHACKEALVRNLLDTVQQIGFAFKYSAKRLLAFKEELGNDPVAQEEMQKRTRLQSLCETRWASRADALYTFKAAYTSIVSALEVLEREGDSKARSYRCSILGFDFIISLVVVEFVLQGVMPLNKLLQKQNIDLIEAANESRVLIATFRAERADDAVWDGLYDKAVAMAEDQGVEPSKPRTARRQQHRGNVPADSVSEYWKRALFYPFLDHLVVELEDRLVSSNERFKAQYLIPNLLPELSRDHEDSIFQEYESDLSGDREAFRNEVSRWKVRWELEGTKPSNLTDTLKATNKTLYPDIFTCLVVLITMPVSTATAERQFSIMRRLKNYMRSTMLTERMSGLALLHAYRHMEIDIDIIINEFAASKGRKLDLL